MDCRDATGAGDALTAGFISRLAEGTKLVDLESIDESSLRNIIEYSMGAGAAAVTALGCTAGVSHAAVEELIANGS